MSSLFGGQIPPPIPRDTRKLELCPKCGFQLPEPDVSCPRCGIVFAHWKAPAPRQWLGPYIYKMVQAAERIVVDKETAKGTEAGAYLEKLVNEHAAQGWEFYRVDEMAMSVTYPEFFGLGRGEGPLFACMSLHFANQRVPLPKSVPREPPARVRSNPWLQRPLRVRRSYRLRGLKPPASRTAWWHA
jgi:hypothetical protein